MGAGHAWTVDLCELFLVEPLYILIMYPTLIEHLRRPCPCFHKLLVHLLQTEL